MTVTSADVDLYVPGRGRDREYHLNVLLKLLIADIAAVSGGGPSSNSGAIAAAFAALSAAGGEVEEPLFVPGQRGQDGTAGATGAQGPVGPALAFLGEEFDETSIPIPPSLGTAAFAFTGSTGHVVPFTDVANTWTANQIIQKANPNFRQSATSGDAAHLINAVSGSAAISRYGFWNGASAVDRWLFGKDATAESGGDAGSNFIVYYYTDAGAFKGVWLGGSRVNGSAYFAGGGVYSFGVTGGAKGSGTANFATTYENGVALSEKYARRDGPFPMFFAEDGEDGMMGPPGAPGPAGAAGGGGGGSATTVEVDLGSTAKFTGKFTITDAAISATSKVMCWQAPGPYTGKGSRADEAEMQPVQVIAVEPASGSAVVKWQTPPMIVMRPRALAGGEPASAIVPGLKDPQALALGHAQRLGKVRGNVKFSYTVFA